MSALHKVFVYGTLKQGQPNHYLLLEASDGRGVARLLDEAKLTERYPMIIHEDCGIPVLLDKPGDGKIVKGELYEVDDTTLATLDRLEDHPNLYTRTPTHCHIITPHRAGAIECETYIMHNCTDDALRRDHHDCYDHSEVSVCVQASRDRTKDDKAAVRKALYSLKCT